MTDPDAPVTEQWTDIGTTDGVSLGFGRETGEADEAEEARVFVRRLEQRTSEARTAVLPGVVDAPQDWDEEALRAAQGQSSAHRA